MSDLFQLLRRSGARELAIVGMTKNVGKTVTLNYLIDSFTRSGVPLGLTSAGYDGERFDRLNLREKPRIFVPAGAVVATAEACFDASEASLELLGRSAFHTPMGEILIGRVKKAGLVEVAGPGSSTALRELMGRMREYGAAQILVDGAINRLASAAPSVTAATILATGASVGPLIDDVIRKTIFRCNILETPALTDGTLLKAAREGLGSGEAALLRKCGETWQAEILHAPIPLLVRDQLRGRHGREIEAVALGGALVDTMLLEIAKLSHPPPAVIIRDATRNFVTPEVYTRYLHGGGKIRVLQPITLPAITANPTDPCGAGYDAGDFIGRLKDALSPRAVFDLVLEGKAVIA